MTTVNDIGEEMLKVQRQITFLKSKRKKTNEDVEEIFVLNRLHGQNKLTQKGATREIWWLLFFLKKKERIFTL